MAPLTLLVPAGLSLAPLTLLAPAGLTLASLTLLTPAELTRAPLAELTGHPLVSSRWQIPLTRSLSPIEMLLLLTSALGVTPASLYEKEFSGYDLAYRIRRM